MASVSRIRTIVALFAGSALLLLPTSSAAGDPVATKSGALINYVSTGKLKVAKSITIPVVCSADCQVTSTVRIKGPGFKLTNTVAGPLTAGVPGGHVIKPNGPLLKSMKADTGKFRLVSNMTATDLATGATDAISHTFKLKR
jgi:hypothetical protein